MEMSNIPLESQSSVRQALTISTFKKSINQEASSVIALLDSLQNTNAKIMENSVTPYKGGSIDLNV